MNVRLYDGSVRCATCFDSSVYESETADPCTYCGSTPTTDTLTNMIDNGTDGTVDVTGSDLPTDGYYVAAASPFNLSGPRDTLSPSLVRTFLAMATRYVGVWTDTDTGHVYLDHVEHHQDKAQALKIAAARSEIAIWDVRHNSEVRV